MKASLADPLVHLRRTFDPEFGGKATMQKASAWFRRPILLRNSAYSSVVSLYRYQYNSNHHRYLRPIAVGVESLDICQPDRRAPFGDAEKNGMW